jgi:hypothetical protein
MLKRERQAVRAAQRVYKAGDTTEVRMEAGLREMLELGGLYVKFAQLLLMNHTFTKIIPAELRREIFDRVHVDKDLTYNDFLTAKDLKLLSGRLKHINQLPSFAGSFAAVFEGRLDDGTEVIIKVLRPELKRTLRQDLRVLGLMSRGIGLFKDDVKQALQGAYQGFRATTLRETNYRAEVNNARLIAQTFEDDTVIHIPKTYAELSTNRFIVQEKLEGIWLSEIFQKGLKGEDAVVYVREKLGTDLPQQLYELGYRSLYATLSDLPVHGDPHPGNVVLLADGRVGLIDFGILAEPITNRLALIDYIKVQIKGKEGRSDLPELMLSIVRFHASYLYRAIDSLSKYYHRPLFKEFYDFLQAEVNRHQESIDHDSIVTGQYSDMLSAAINKDNRFALMPKIDTPITQKAFITLWRTFEELGLDAVTLEIFKKVVVSIERDFPTDDWKEAPMPIDKAFEVIGEWLATVAEKDPQLFKNLKALFKPVSNVG